MYSQMGKINLSPAEPTLYAKDLDRLVDLWLSDMARRVAQETIAGYAYKVAHFRDWWSAVGPTQSWQLRQRDLETFAYDLMAVPLARGTGTLSYHTRNDVHRRLRQMFRWAFTQGYTDSDYSLWVPTAPGEPPRRVVATLDALRQLFEAATQSSHPARNRAMLAMFIGTGIRRGECAGLQIEDLQFYADGSGIASVTGKRTRNNRSGERQVAFDTATGSYLVVHINGLGVQAGPLWVGHRGPLTKMGIYKAVKMLIERAGVAEMVQGPHDLRRAFATHFARRYKDPVHADILRRQMGHSTWRMSSQYLLMDAEDLRESLHSPMEDILSAAEGVDIVNP